MIEKIADLTEKIRIIKDGIAGLTTALRTGDVKGTRLHPEVISHVRSLI